MATNSHITSVCLVVDPSHTSVQVSMAVVGTFFQIVSYITAETGIGLGRHLSRDRDIVIRRIRAIYMAQKATMKEDLQSSVAL